MGLDGTSTMELGPGRGRYGRMREADTRPSDGLGDRTIHGARHSVDATSVLNQYKISGAIRQARPPKYRHEADPEAPRWAIQYGPNRTRSLCGRLSGPSRRLRRRPQRQSIVNRPWSGQRPPRSLRRHFMMMPAELLLPSLKYRIGSVSLPGLTAGWAKRYDAQKGPTC